LEVEQLLAAAKAYKFQQRKKFAFTLNYDLRFKTAASRNLFQEEELAVREKELQSSGGADEAGSRLPIDQSSLKQIGEQQPKDTMIWRASPDDYELVVSFFDLQAR